MTVKFHVYLLIAHRFCISIIIVMIVMIPFLYIEPFIPKGAIVILWQ